MNRMRTALVALLGTATLLAPTASADTPASGFSLTTQANPAFSAATCTLPGGDIVTFDGASIDRWTSAGAFVQNLGTIPFAFPSFCLAAPGGTEVVIGDSGSGAGPDGSLHVVQADGSGVAFLATVVYAYDAAFLPGGDLVVSAAASGSGNDLVRVVLGTGATTTIGNVAGASGPVAVDAAGDLYYATLDASFPPPAGSTDVVYWTAAQVAAGGLSDANATVFSSGYDGATSIAFDPVRDRLFMAESVFGGVHRILRVRPNAANSSVVLDGIDTISNLEFVSAGGPAAFQAYQPGDGSRLKYDTTDFATFSDQGLVAPARPVLTATGPGVVGTGNVTFTVTGGVPNGTMFLVACDQTAIGVSEQPISLPGFTHYTAFNFALTFRGSSFLLPTDASGQGAFTIWNPGTLQGTLGYQFFVGSAAGSFVGSSNHVEF